MTLPEPRASDWLNQYVALAGRAGIVDLPERTQIEVVGPDAATWLNNLMTNEIRKLAPGAGCEAFVTTVQGKTLGHVLVFVLAQSVVLDTVPAQAETLLAHLEHYHIREDVTLVDRTRQWSEVLVAGPDAPSLLEKIGAAPPPVHRWSHAPSTLGGKSVWVRQAELVGPVGYLISGPRGDVPAVRQALRDAGAVACGEPAFEAARIEWGFPWFGTDISSQNLPQEVARDTSAISFVKGCYLGQETVARIDALGHVNRTLVGVRFTGSTVPPPGLELAAAGQSAGKVTSAALSPALAAPLALAYVRRGVNTPGARLNSEVGDAEVVALPVR
jgi:folate-binding protein YgfZ